MARVNYPAILAEAWAQHLAPRNGNAPTVISTFAGCGGSSLGYSMAGYRELLAVEWNDNAVETFKLNFPGVPVYHGDIHKLTVEQCLKLAGVEVGELDLLDGSPPCQGFSTAGKRQMTDQRNQLYMQFVRLLRGLQPKVFVMENVSGLVKGKMKLIFADIMRELKDSGYKVRCKLLNAKYFNVPQSRQRLIFIGAREDLGATVSFPGAESGAIAVRDALPWIVEMQAGSYCSEWKNAARQPMASIVSSDGARSHRSAIRTATEERKYTIAELKSIGSFPDCFKMTGDYEVKWARIGNSVPPLFMRAIAGHIRREILT